MKYLVIEYTEEKKAVYHLIERAELWIWLDRAKRDDVKIAVYEAGACIIDWSWS